MQIRGSSAIVVGGAGGLGEATVRRLHAAGAKVIIADLADEKGKALAGPPCVSTEIRSGPSDSASANAVFTSSVLVASVRT
jgi:NAD(P)-dependent dehydrogenase (short-subunit alcohol dehydrogenase family)